LVGRRGRCTRSAARSAETTRSSASSRFRDWLRSSSATARSTGPARLITRAFCTSVSDGEAATSNDASTLVSVFCACWPPGPLDRDVRKLTSERAIETLRVTWILFALDSPAMASILAVGVDLIEIDRVRRTLARYRDFRERCFTEAERTYCDSRPNPAQHYAARFAGKEAVGKALGFGVAVHFAWREIEIAGRPKPSVRLSGRLAERAERLGAGEIELSMTHSKELAAAVAVVSDV